MNDWNWPASPAMLTDSTRCPACFQRLVTMVCDRCGLDLRTPGSEAVLTASRELVALTERRGALITGLREQQRAAVDTTTASGAAASTTVTTAAALLQPAPPVPPKPALRVPVEAAADPAGPRRSGVQVLLLVAGVTALSVAAVFFLFVAYLVATLAVRSLITAALSVAVLLVAGLLRRRGLAQTAEGVAVIGVVLLLLDLWIVRANDLFGSQRVDPWLFAGAGLVVASALAAGVRRVGRLRAGSVTAALLLPAGAALVVAGAIGTDRPAAVWAAALAAAFVGVVAGDLRADDAESLVGRGAAALAVLIAAAAAWPALPGDGPERGLAFLAAAGPCVLHLALARRRPTSVRRTVDVPAAIALASALGEGALIVASIAAPDPLLPVLAAAGPALLPPAVLLILRRWIPRPAAIAAGATAAVALVVVLPLALVAGWAFAQPLIAAAAAPFGGDGYSLVDLDPGPLATGIGGALLVVAVTAVVVRRRTLAVAAAATLAAGLLALGGASGSVRVAVACAAVAGTVAVADLAAGRLRHPVLALVVLLAATLQLTALARLDGTGWLLTTAVALVLLGGARPFVRSGGAALSGLLVARLLLAALGLPEWVAAIGAPDLAAVPPAATVLLTAAVLLLGSAAALRLRIPQDDRAAVDGLAAAATVIAAAVLPFAGWSGSAAIGALAAGGLVAAALVHLVLRPDGIGAGLGAAAGPVLLTGGTALGLVAWAPTGHGSAAVPIALAVLAAAAVSIVLLRRTPEPARTVWDGMTLSVAAAVAMLALADAAWPALLLLAVAVLLVACSDGEPFRARTWRRQAGWASAALGLAAVWQAVAARGVMTVEAYSLPAAVLLALLTVAVSWRSTAADGGARSALALAAAGTALVPTAVEGIADGGQRLVVAGCVAAALMLAARWLPSSLRFVRLEGIALVTGFPVLAAAAVAGLVHTRGTAAAEVWWLLPSLAFGATAVLLRRSEPAAGRVAAVLALALPVVAALLATSGPDPIPLRSVAVAALEAGVALAVVAARVDGGATGRLVLRTALGGSVLCSVIGAVLSAPLNPAPTAIGPLEIATAPLALALTAIGALRLHRDALRRSWPELGPGLAVLLVPSLLLDAQPAVLWRVVTLGLVALAVMVAGVVRNLSAPFLIGGAVLVVHALAQLWPWISTAYGAVQWWLWLGVAGVVLVALAATYERRVVQLRSAARLLAGQR